jgi:branched-chain amino acid transport system permease protein
MMLGRKTAIEGVPLPIVLVGLAALCVYPLIFAAPSIQNLMILTLLFGAMGSAWNILGGYAGQVSLGHGTYFGIGAYTVGFLYAKYQLSPWLTWPLALMLTVVAATIIGAPTFRLRGHYFVLASVFIVDAIHTVVANTNVLGAAIGIEYPLNRRDDLWSALWTLQYHGSKLPYYYAALGLFVISVVVSWRIQNKPLGYYLRAIRDDQDAAQSLGIDVVRYKLIALLISAAIVTLCGIFYAQYVLYVEPAATMSLALSVQIAFIAIFGGIGMLWGPILGAFVIVPATEFLRIYFSGAIAPKTGDWSLSSQIAYYLAGGGGNVDLILYGLLVMVIARYQPNGMLGFFRQMR